VVADKEFFEFLNKLFPETVYAVDVLPLMIRNLHCNYSIISFSLLTVALFAFDDSNHSALHDTTEERGFISSIRSEGRNRVVSGQLTKTDVQSQMVSGA
jgi:hypothetical protein